MASGHSDYIQGSMPVDGHNKTFKGFIKGSAFSSALLIVLLLMPILLFTVHLSWVPALAITFIVGLLIAPAMKLGSGWYGVLIGLTIFTALLCIAVTAL